MCYSAIFNSPKKCFALCQPNITLANILSNTVYNNLKECADYAHMISFYLLSVTLHMFKLIHI